MTALALWRRLDAPGHDTARLDPIDGGWLLHGHAIFRAPSGPAQLTYLVVLGEDWTTQEAQVTGWIGARDVLARISREGGWRFNDEPIAGLDHCVDIDIGFTPATNLHQLKRLALPVGGRAAFDVAWLDDEVTGLTALPQVYERRTESLYAYESPTSGYAETLDFRPDGFVRDYPGLWRMEAG